MEDVESGRLRPPSSLPELASLDISPEYLDKTHFRNPPKVELGPDGVLRYRGEADDIDSSPPLLTAPLSGLPLLTDGRVTDASSSTPKRKTRYDPYGSPTIPKRSRKQHKNSSDEALSSAEQRESPGAMTPPTPHPSTSYPEPGTAGPAPPGPYPPYGIPTFYQVPGYPVHHPHIFPPTPGSYPSGMPPIVPQQSGIPPGLHPLAAVPGPSNGGIPDSGPTQYYPYYPHHPTYAGYHGMAWPYPGYHPQPVPQMLPPPPPSEGDDKTDDEKETENSPGLE